MSNPFAYFMLNRTFTKWKYVKFIPQSPILCVILEELIDINPYMVATTILKRNSLLGS